MPHTVPTLPYAYNALEPHIDETTMRIHHDKHHQAYVDKLNAALAGHPELEKKKVEELLADLTKVPETIRGAVRNHGGGHWNHTFFWEMLKKNDGKAPANEVGKAIVATFSSFDKFKEAFANAALGQFGSGWAWLVLAGGKLEVVATPNQDCPLSAAKIPLLGIDVWEHAYYIKYQNKRADYVAAFWNVVNWEQVNKLYLAAKKK